VHYASFVCYASVVVVVVAFSLWLAFVSVIVRLLRRPTPNSINVNAICLHVVDVFKYSVSCVLLILVYACSHRVVTMTENKISFGVTTKGKQMVLRKQFEFVKHREYGNGTIQWRCKLYQKCRCQARITTDGDDIVSVDPEHNHSGNRETALARQAVGEMKTNMSELSATTRNVMAHVSAGLEPGVLVALPKKQSLERTLQRSRNLQTAADPTSLPFRLCMWTFMFYRI